MSLNKKIILILSLLSIPIILLIVSRLLKFYILYSIPTTGMEPNVKRNQVVFASSLISPKKNDIVSYDASSAALYGENVTEMKEIIGRIVAIENDTLEIKNGLLYLNNVFVDDTMNLCYNYLLSQYVWDGGYTINYCDVWKYTHDTVIMNVSPKALIQSGIIREENPIRMISPASEYIHPYLFNCNSELNWSADNFGPVIIPKDHFFIMGDNRSNSADSRYRGFVKKSNIIAVVLKQ